MGIRAWSTGLAFCAVLTACSKNQCPSVSSDAQWESLVSGMKMPDYRVKRLDDYISTLESSGCQVGQIDGAARTTAAATLDHEIARSLPLFVPADHVQEAHDYLVRTLGLR